MVELPQTLENVRKRIVAHHGTKAMNEQNTKTALIQPVLSALGWEVGNLDEVSQEYRRRPTDKPVDYALFLQRMPRLFVEAKALGQDLADRRWTSQIISYAAVAGLKWVVLTNGGEYRIYNACVDVPVEEKLFRTVRVSEEGATAEATLTLLSKDRIRDNDIETLWESHFVDRQVQAALEGLFVPEPHGAVVRLVKSQVGGISAKDVLASLGRVRVQFHFPAEPASSLPHLGKPRQHRARKESVTLRSRNRATKGNKTPAVSLRDLIEADLLRPPLKLTVRYKGRQLDAQLLADGMIRFQGKAYPTPSAAANSARTSVTGRPVSTNGWEFWHFVDEHGALVLLDTVRQAYAKRGVR